MRVRSRPLLTPLLLGALAGVACARAGGDSPPPPPSLPEPAAPQGAPSPDRPPPGPAAPVVSPEIALDPIVWRPGDDADKTPAVVWTGTDYLIAWSSVNTIEGLCRIRVTRMTADGEIAAPQGTFAEGFDYCSPPAIAWNGERALVVWSRHVFGAPPGGGKDLLGVLIGGDGQAISPEPFLLAATADSTLTRPAAAAYGDHFFVAFADVRNSPAGETDIYATRVGPGGAVLDPDGIPVATGASAQQLPDAAWDGESLAVVWQDDRNGWFDVYGARVSPDGAVLDPAGVALCTAPGHQAAPRLASSGATRLVVWADPRNGTYDVYGARWSPAGAVLDPEGFPISQAAAEQTSPDVAWDGQSFTVLWSDGRK